MYIQYLTDSSVTKVLLISSWVKLSNIECTFRFFKNSGFDGYMNKSESCDFVINCKGLWAGGNDLESAWEGRQEMREVKVSDRAHYHSTTSVPDMEEMHSRKWDWNHHTPAYTQCPSLSVVHRQQKLSVFTWGTLGFHSSRCRGSVCAFQSLEFEITSQLCLANNHRNSNT